MGHITRTLSTTLPSTRHRPDQSFPTSRCDGFSRMGPRAIGDLAGASVDRSSTIIKLEIRVIVLQPRAKRLFYL